MNSQHNIASPASFVGTFLSERARQNIADDPFNDATVAYKAEEMDDLRANQLKLFHSGAYADLTIKCGTEEFPVHKAIEGQTGIVNLPDDDPGAMKIMLQYLYTMSSPSAIQIFGSGPTKTSKKALKILVMADKYVLPKLFRAIITIMVIEFSKGLGYRLISANFQVNAAVNGGLDFSREMLEVVFDPESNAPVVLRGLLVAELAKHPDIVTQGFIQELVEDNDSFADELIMALTHSNNSQPAGSI